MPEGRLAGRTVAVTGASGGIGSAAVARLLGEGARVRGLTRSAAGAEALRRMGAEPVRGDVTDPAALTELMTGAAAALHLAAWMGGKGGRAEAERVNVEGARVVAAAAAAARVARLVHVSSVAVYGPRLAGLVTESEPTRAVGDPYADTKLAGEAAALAAAAAAGLELVILRPSMVYGPGVASWTLAPLRALAAGVPMAFGAGDYLLDAVYVDDVARAAVLALSEPRAAGAVLNVTGAPTTWLEFLGAYGAMLDRHVRRLPAWLVRGVARAAGVVTRPLGPARVVGEMVEVMLSRATFSGAAAQATLGYRPEVPLGDGMRLTADWLRAEGLIAGPRTALVVGAGSGLGLAVARELERRYVRVVAADLDPSAAAEPPQAAALLLRLDVLEPSGVAAAVGELERGGLELDAAIITVGGLRPGALESQPLADVRWQLDLNALGPLNVVRAVAPGMRERGRGRVVAVGSTNGFLVTPFMGAYSAGKFALEALMDALRLELRPFGVEVVLVQPGAMRTPFAERAKARLSAEADRTGAPWADYLRRLRDSELWGQRTAADPEAVARVVAAAVTARRAPARVRGTAEVPFVRLFSCFPDIVKDRVFVGPLGLKRPARRP